MNAKVRLGKHLFEVKNMRGEPCPYVAGFQVLDKDSPTSCNEIGWCLSCSVYLDSFKKQFCGRCNEKGACGKEKTVVYGCQAQVGAGIWHWLHLRGVE